METLGNIGDFVSGIAVVVTLVYLAIQIRTNTNAIQSTNCENVAREYREVTAIAGDPVIARAIGTGLRKYPNLTYEQVVRFHNYMNGESLFFQGVFARHETGRFWQLNSLRPQKSAA